MDKDNMLFGQLNQEIELLEYTGKKTDTANVTVDNTEQTISVDVLKLPNTLTIKENKEHRENIVSHTFDGSRDVEVDLTGYATDAETQEKLDTKRDKIVRSETQDPQYTLVYSQNTNGVESSIPTTTSAVAGSIPIRNSNGNLVGVNAQGGEYTPFSQVDAIAKTKVTKITVESGKPTRVYGVNSNGETSIPVDKSAVANAIAWRNANANLVGNDATANNEYTPLAQVEQLLDTKRDIVPIPSNGTRFYIANSTNGQSYAEGGTSANNKYQVVQRADNAQIKAPNQATFPPLDDEYICKSYADNNYLKKTGGNITGSLSLTKDLTVGGNLTVNGTTTTVESTTLQVKDKLIEVAHGNTSPLTTPAGIVAPNYNGNDSGAMVFDNTGTAYVGDVTLDASGNIDVGKSHLQPLATRNLSSANDGQLVKWDEANKTLVGSGKAIDDISTATNIENGTGVNTLQQAPAQSTFINTIVGYTKNDPEGSTAGADAYGPYVDPVIYNATDNTTTTVNSGVNSTMFGGLSHNEGGAPTTVRPNYTGDASQSFITGRRNINIGDYNSVFNTDNIIYGDNCFVSGLRNISVNNETTVMGTGLIANKLGQVVLGRYNIPDNNAAFILGGGWQQQHKDGTNPDGSNKYVLDSITRKTLFKINENGDTYVNGHLNVSLAPVDSGDVVRLQELNGKLDKLTPKANSILYGLTPEGSNQGFETGTANIFQYAIPQRTVDGQIAMPNQATYAPTDDQAISKRFADNNYEKLRTPLVTGDFLYEISKSTTGTIQRSLHGYGVTAKPSSIVKRTTKGQIELPDQTASAPTDDQAISKGYADANYLKGALPTVGTSTSSKDLKKIVYTAESDIPATPEEGVEYACTDLIGEEDLAPSFVNKVNGKQDLLTFDTTPTANSTNPVTSGGIYDAISQFITIQVSDSLMGG